MLAPAQHLIPVAHSERLAPAKVQIGGILIEAVACLVVSYPSEQNLPR